MKLFQAEITYGPMSIRRTVFLCANNKEEVYQRIINHFDPINIIVHTVNEWEDMAFVDFPNAHVTRDVLEA